MQQKFKIKPPAKRILTDKQREALSERMKRVRNNTK